MRILGLSFGYHDSAAALVSENGIIAAAHEERFSRKKNDAGFPLAAITHCLNADAMKVSDLDYIIYYEDALTKFDRIAEHTLSSGDAGKEYLSETAEDWFRFNKFYPSRVISEKLNFPESKIKNLAHHASHAASCYFLSPFSDAAILTIDGVGERETLTISRGENNKITKLQSVEYPHSLGLFYSAFTAFLGFEVNEGEYKVMGMAAFGKPKFYEKISTLLSFSGNCRFELDQSYFNFSTAQSVPYSQKLIECFGSPREPEAPFSKDGQTPINDQAQYYADIAASIQLCTEESLLRLAREGLSMTQSRNVCMAGGVALNSAANGRIRREVECDLFIQPAAGDAGTALGAAVFQLAQSGYDRLPSFTQPYLGTKSSLNQTVHAFEQAGISNYQIFQDETEMVEEVSSLIAQGLVVGWMQGEAEWGPRALGNRSILAHPGKENMKNIVNQKIKFREPFRPFAPSVLVEHAAEYFDIPEAAYHASSPESFMLAVCPVKSSAKQKIPAVTHVDGSARVHLVRREINPRYYSLIEAFGRRTQLPMLLNTSFNLRGEAIVNQPQHAIQSFLWCEMDALVIDLCLVKKSAL